MTPGGTGQWLAFSAGFVLFLGAFQVECIPRIPPQFGGKSFKSVKTDDASQQLLDADIGHAVYLTKAPIQLPRASLRESTTELTTKGTRSLKFGGGCSDTDSSIYAVLECTNAVRTNPDAFAADYPCFYDSWRHEAVGKGLGELKLDPTLIQMAQRHTDDQAHTNIMSHTGSDGTSLSMRADRVNYHWSSLGENVAVGFDSAKRVVMAWMCSEGHRKNLLSCTFDTIGIGNAHSLAGRNFYTQNFGCGGDHTCSCSSQSGYSSFSRARPFATPASSSFLPGPSSFGSQSTDAPTSYQGFSTSSSNSYTSASPSSPTHPLWTDQFVSSFTGGPATSSRPAGYLVASSPSPSPGPDLVASQASSGSAQDQVASQESTSAAQDPVASLASTSQAQDPVASLASTSRAQDPVTSLPSSSSAQDLLTSLASSSSAQDQVTSAPDEMASLTSSSPADLTSQKLVPDTTVSTETTPLTTVQDPVTPVTTANPAELLASQSQLDQTSAQPDPASDNWKWECKWDGPNWSCERVLQSGTSDPSSSNTVDSTSVFTIGK